MPTPKRGFSLLETSLQVPLKPLPFPARLRANALRTHVLFIHGNFHPDIDSSLWYQLQGFSVFLAKGSSWRCFGGRLAVLLWTAGRALSDSWHAFVGSCGGAFVGSWQCFGGQLAVLWRAVGGAFVGGWRCFGGRQAVLSWAAGRALAGGWHALAGGCQCFGGQLAVLSWSAGRAFVGSWRCFGGQLSVLLRAAGMLWRTVGCDSLVGCQGFIGRLAVL